MAWALWIQVPRIVFLAGRATLAALDSQSFKSVLVGRVLLARAIGDLTVAAMATVLKEVAAARRTAGVPLLYWPILDPTADMPPPEVRSTMRDATEALFRSCESMTLIIPGPSMKMSLLRAFMRGFVRIAGHSRRVRIVETLADAVAAANDPDIDLMALTRAASAAGIEVQSPAGANEPARL
jgi:hypothetical protein